MRMIRSFWRFILCLVPLLLVGCAGTLQYPPFPDQAKKVEDPAKARIYAIRKEKFVGSAVAILFYGPASDVATGPIMGRSPKKRLIGEIGPGSYICWEEPPGPFKFARVENDPNSAETLNLEAGHVYYLRVYIHTGWTKALIKAKVLDEKEGQELLKHCNPPNDYRKK